MAQENLEFQPTPEDLKILREWLKKMPHLVQDYDDEFLATFVRGSKGSLQKTKTYLENFNGLGMKYPSFFGHLNVFDPVLQEHLSNMMLFPLPKNTKNNSIVFIKSLNLTKNVDPYKVHLFETYRYWLMSIFVKIWENESGEAKATLIFDWKNWKISHGRDLTPSVIKALFEILETSIPVRVQGIHIINLPTVFEWVLNFVKSLVQKKMADRIMFHSNMETLQEMIGKEILPKEYGGDEVDMATLNEQWKKKLESYSDRLQEEYAKMRVLDQFRPKLDNEQELAGTFKTLVVD